MFSISNMGYPYHELIPPAILLDHPGLTKDEYIEALDETHGSGYTKFEPEEPWDSYNEEEKDHHEGSQGLAAILNLEESTRYTIFRTPMVDGNSLLVKPPQQEFTWRPDDPIELVVHKENKVGLPLVLPYSSYERKKEGDQLEIEVGDFEGATILEVLEEKVTKPRSKRDMPYFTYSLKVLPLTEVIRVEQLDSKEELWQKWPDFHPDNRYNFAQSRGHFRLSHDFSGGQAFRWIMADGRYFLDPETFDLIPASWEASNWECLGYVDLIATAEAIKHKAWKLLSRKGLDHYAAFLRDFPDSKDRIERATWDTHMALASKKYCETVNDLLRRRLFPQGYF